ncbi:hypothetical protein LTR02_008440 [Friedmanniomyces endolithicus]|nr:hypothetical protein LTR94_011189 [Friedmanniomyces endolithicus]KAK0797937.1 hypothetical protein LTR59_006602 [Friedmanniomyces endolithicus]KAK0806925.1 hypothetical protein LTR38_005077 [Friedmanniomyces endolithicus]KAK0821606.1 hypothetical protein LTR75_000692 [Friedmanniomyces endolithicus]KAK0857057.1 hypothetical protein LTR03_000978 [Friedmanniomyces endolithicus]
MRSGRAVLATTAALLIGALPLIAAHGENANVSVAAPLSNPNDGHQNQPPSYFNHGNYGGWMLAHITLMVLAWVFAMPLAIMLSVARSRYHLPAQLIFHVLNGVGVFTGFVYNHATPDLYGHNAHHPIGWIATSSTVVWTIASLYTAYGDYRSNRDGREHPLSSHDTAHYRVLQQYSDRGESARWSGDSGMGSSRHHSSESIPLKPDEPESHNGIGDDRHDTEDDDEEEPEKRGFLSNNKVDRIVALCMQYLLTPRASSLVQGSQIILEKILLLLGFFALSTGSVTYSGLGRGNEAFSIAAHFAKGGIFVWYGVLTLGRWMGAFSEFGWAWNVRPKYPVVARWKTRVPSAEFVESFVIWLYGASNVFLEHLNNLGGEWSPEDFEHVSLTALFFGGGLLGMMVEFAWFRKQLDTNVVLQRSKDRELADLASHPTVDGAESGTAAVPHDQWQEPNTHQLSLNPMPGLVIMILGIMMSAHHQDSMVSTMMHAQWGTLFFAFAIARATTYVLLYLKPPTSHFPARPPSELVSAFCLISGGLLFMISAHDTVWAIETSGLDAMAVFAVTLGLTGVVMAWEVVCYAVKGWAVRKERAVDGQPLP